MTEYQAALIVAAALVFILIIAGTNMRITDTERRIKALEEQIEQMYDFDDLRPLARRLVEENTEDLR